jgi:hypothetical protein
MARRTPFLFPVSLALLAGSAAGGVYKCEVDGKIVFSDTRCATDSEAIDIRYRQSDPGEAAEIERRTEEVQEQVARRQHANRIAAQKREITRLERERDRKLSALRDKKAFANNNLAGAAWEQSISTEMTAVAEQYRQKIDSAEKELARIQAQQ